jgi:hypothetical protein
LIDHGHAHPEDYSIPAAELWLAAIDREERARRRSFLHDLRGAFHWQDDVFNRFLRILKGKPPKDGDGN